MSKPIDVPVGLHPTDTLRLVARIEALKVGSDPNAPELFYDRTGLRISLEGWQELVMQDNYRTLASSTVHKDLVSTIWLGVSHGERDGKPLLFETMVFHKRKTNAPIRCVRYVTEQEAIRGHEQMCAEHARRQA